MIVLGIDGGKTTALALVEVTQTPRWRASWSGDVLDLLEAIHAGRLPLDDPPEIDGLLVAVEWPQGISGLFNRHRQKRLSRQERDSLAFNIGRNHRDADLVARALERRGAILHRWTPHGPKWKHERVRLLFRDSAPPRTNEHVRDAARAAFSHPGHALSF